MYCPLCTDCILIFTDCKCTDGILTYTVYLYTDGIPMCTDVY